MKRIEICCESEALEFCSVNHCIVEFVGESGGLPAHVIVSLGLVAKAPGRDLTEAVNRIIDMYFTPRCDFYKLPWWGEQKKYYVY